MLSVICKGSGPVGVGCLLMLLNCAAWGQEGRGFQPDASGGTGLRRVALVIGNNAYPTAKLANAVADARAMKATLTDLGFKVYYKEDADRRAMEEAVEAFKQDLNKDTVGLFYFSGHGLQIEGSNYLVPAGVAPRDRSDARYDYVPAGKIIDKMTDSGVKMNIIILDACRNNPFSSGTRSQTRGLARMNGGTGSLIAYATAPGEVASDGGKLANGLYTHYLLKHLKTPAATLEQVFKNTARDVHNASQQQQTPWYHSSVLGDFYFVPDRERDTVAKPSDDAQLLKEAIELYSGIGGHYDLARAHSLFLESSASGNPLGTMWVARCYHKGRSGFPLDEAKAKTLAEAALPKVQQLARTGNVDAMFLWASAKHEGLGTAEDNAGAAAWYRKAADLGYPLAQYNLGVMYQYGKGVTQSDEMAVQWYRKAAEQNDAFAQNDLGWMYQYGKGVTQSDEMAVQWFRKAAEQNHAIAQNNLGWMYDNGAGVTQSDEVAVQWFRKAAEQGNATAQYNLATRYENGRSVAKSLPTAIDLYRKAASQGYEDAQKALTRLGESP